MRSGSGRSTANYRGPDRRTHREAAPSTTDTSWRWGGALLVGAGSLGVWSSLDARIDLTTAAASAGVQAAALVLALVLAITGHLCWRASGEAAGAFVAVSGTLVAATAALDVRAGADPSLGSEALVHAGLSLAAATWLARAATGPTVDSAIRPERQALTAASTVAAIVAVSVLLPDEATSSLMFGVVAHALATVGWALTAVLILYRARHRERRPAGWMVWLAVAMTAAELARTLAVSDASTWLFAAAGARATGCLLGAVGGVSGLARTTAARRDRLHLAAVREQQLHHDHDAARELDIHELRTALLTIEGAAATLRDHRDVLPEIEQRQLDEAVSTGITHLRGLLTPVADDATPLPLAELVRGQASSARLRGMDVEVSGDDALQVSADQRLLVQVLDNLLANAERHGVRDGEVRVHIDLSASEDRVVVRVRDHGPGIPEGQHELIFVSGVRLDHRRPGDGVGLYLSRQLVLQQGGTLWAEDAVDGGACFVLSLPRAASGEGDVLADEPQDRSEILEAGSGTIAPGSDRASTPQR